MNWICLAQDKVQGENYNILKSTFNDSIQYQQNKTSKSTGRVLRGHSAQKSLSGQSARLPDTALRLCTAYWDIALCSHQGDGASGTHLRNVSLLQRDFTGLDI